MDSAMVNWQVILPRCERAPQKLSQPLQSRSTIDASVLEDFFHFKDINGNISKI